MDLAGFRKSRGLSQDELAAELGGFSKAYISQLETGDAPIPLELALKIERWSAGELLAVDLVEAEKGELLREAIERAVARPKAKAPA